MAALNADIPEELKKALARACIDRNVTMKEAVANAISEWLAQKEYAQGGPSGDSQPTTRKVGTYQVHDTAITVEAASGVQSITSGELPWVVRLLNILRSGTVASRGIKWNLMMVAKAMGLPFDKPSLLPAPAGDIERAARDEIATAERLIAQSEQLTETHQKPRKGDRRTGSR